MKKNFQIVLIVLFALFIAGFGIFTLALPDKDFSENENRYLSKFPEFTAESFFEGDFGTDFETYLADQFPLREQFIEIKATSEKLTGKLENNGAYLAGDSLISRVDEPDASRVDTNLSYLNDLAANLDAIGIPGYLTVLPTAATVHADKLPYGAPTADESAWLDYIESQTQLGYIDTESVLKDHSDEKIFYNTDHHWTTLGAYYGYTAVAEALGFTPKSQDEFEKFVLSDSFLGTTYSSSGVRDVEPETIEGWSDESKFVVTRTDEKGEYTSELYVDSFLTQKDKYSAFLGGNSPLVVVKNKEINDGSTLVVIRDSYADSEVAFLAEHFDVVHLVDPRYYKTSGALYAQQVGADAVLVSYGFSNFVTSSDMFALGQPAQ